MPLKPPDFQSFVPRPTVVPAPAAEARPPQPRVRDGFETTGVERARGADPIVTKAVQDTSNLFEELLKEFGEGKVVPPFDDPFQKLDYLTRELGQLIEKDPEILAQIRRDPTYQRELPRIAAELTAASARLPDGPSKWVIEQAKALVDILGGGPEEPGPSQR